MHHDVSPLNKHIKACTYLELLLTEYRLKIAKTFVLTSVSKDIQLPRQNVRCRYDTVIRCYEEHQYDRVLETSNMSLDIA